MFNRHRRRASSNPALKPPPSTSASLAATKAFIKDRESNASLSSSAAAAALRTHPTSPTPVGDTITKRMARKGSVSSQGSGSQQAPGLRRHSSSGSMTERSFRAPSPARNSPRNSPVDPSAPPVPAVPKDPPSVSVVHRRTSSLEPPFRGGSPMGRGGGRGVSLDRGVAEAPGRGRPRVTSLSQVPEDEQDGSPRSINFSRPISPPLPMSPTRPVASQRGANSGWFGGPVVNPEVAFRGTPKQRPKTSEGLSAFDAHSTQQAIQHAADRPVATKKTQLAHGVEGARLSTGSMRGKPSGSAVQSKQPPAAHPERPRMVDPKSPYAVYDPSTRTFIHKQDAMALHRELSETEREPAPPYTPQHGTSQQYHEMPAGEEPTRQSTVIRHVIHRPPSPEPQRATPVETRPLHDRDEAPASLPDAAKEVKSERPPTPPVSRPPAGAALARQNSEDFADADIRPSMDANTSRKLEAAAPEDSVQSQNLASNQDGAYPRLAPPVTPTMTNTVPASGPDSVRSERTQSMSPPRNAHFAAVALELPNSIRHQPPPRSVSPAKSALKSSPSVSRRSNSPLANDGRVVSREAASEASDAVSEDGSKKKKKNVRVSFDEEPVVAGTSAYAEAEIPTSPTGLGASKWSTANEGQSLDDFMTPRPILPSFGSIRDKNRRPRESDSLEKVTETVSSSLSTSVASASEPLEPSSDHAIGSILSQDFANKKSTDPQEPLPPEVTSVEGSGYYSDSDRSSTLDNEAFISPLHEMKPIVEPTRSMPEPEPKTLTTPAEVQPPAPEVPSIAIQPASPSPVDRPEPKLEPVAPEPVKKPEPKAQHQFVPGGWDEDEESEPEVELPAASQTELTSESLRALGDQLQVSQPDVTESTDDDSSIYSDAYEDLSEAEDGGFASIDAVVESPIIAPSGLMFSKFADQPSVEPPTSALRNEYAAEPFEPHEEADEEEPSKAWSAAGKHWSQLNGSRKQQEQPGAPAEQTTPKAITAEELVTPAAPPAPSKQTKAITEPRATTKAAPKSKPMKTSQPSDSAAQPRKSALKKPAIAPQPTGRAEPQMRKTMRGGPVSVPSPPPERQFKKSMRDGAPAGPARLMEPHMRTTMRGADPGMNRPATSSGLAASRYSMPPMETKPHRGALQKKHLPAAAANTASKPRPQSAAGPVVSKSRTPVPTYDSDSDASVSSFRRERPRASRNEGGRYTMRGSMRSGPAPTMRPTPTMRPMSPPQATSPPPALRKSLRPLSPTAEPVGHRSSRFSIRSLSPAGRFRPSKTTAESAPPMPAAVSSPKRTPAKTSTFGKSSKAKAPAPAAAKPRYKSRFADSSDEEDGDRPTRFQSRFADSDDDSDEFELPPGLAPVRGIPKRPGEEDRESTDLEDEESDTEAPPVPADVDKGKPTTTNGVTNGQGVNFAAVSLGKSKHAPELPAVEGGKKPKAKRGFFGLRKKKTSSSYLDNDADARNGAAADIPMPPAQRNSDRNRPLTPIGEDKDIEAAEPPARSPKLQRRAGTPQWGRSTSDSWPLPQPPAIGEEKRPQSSDGVVNRRSSLRPTLNKRHSSQVSEPARTAIDPKSGKEVVVGRSGKKKKFQGLRRVFGLND